MKFFIPLSRVLKQDIYLMNSGDVYLRHHGFMRHIGNQQTPIPNLRKAIAEYL